MWENQPSNNFWVRYFPKKRNSSKAFITEKFETMRQCPNTYFVTVIEDTALHRIIGAATLFVEHKFIHGCGKVIQSLS